MAGFGRELPSPLFVVPAKAGTQRQRRLAGFPLSREWRSWSRNRRL